MKRFLLLSLVVLVAMVFAVSAFAASKGTMVLKVGDEIYACNCGEKCPCNTMSRNPGKCTCGTDMVKAKVMKIEEGKAYLKAPEWNKERVFTTVGKYTCGCSPTCKCDTISQNPGKCTCGADMIKVEKSK